MILYYDDTGKLLTMLPHGETPRQGGHLHIDVLMNLDFNNNQGFDHKIMTLRFKKPSLSFFSGDFVMTKNGSYTFEMLDEENIGSLVNGRTYYRFSCDLSETEANDEYGRLEVVMQLHTTQTVNNVVSYVAGETLTLGRASIYVEETLGLAPYSGIGMTHDEYTRLLAYISELTFDAEGVQRLAATKADRTNLQQVIQLGSLIFPNGWTQYVEDDNFILEKSNGVKLLLEKYTENSTDKYRFKVIIGSQTKAYVDENGIHASQIEANSIKDSSGLYELKIGQNGKELSINNKKVLTEDDIEDNLISNNSDKVLSAKQGKILNDAKVNKEDISDNLTTDDNTKVLSAKQGKILNDAISNLVVNSLESNDDTKALSALMGKNLSESIATLYNYVGYATDNDSDTAINKLREIFQFLSGENDNDTLLSLLYDKVSTSEFGFIMITSQSESIRLTTGQMVEAQKHFCIICRKNSNGSDFYYKNSETSSIINFISNIKPDTSTEPVSYFCKAIEISKSDNSVTFRNIVVQHYDASKEDELLALKQDKITSQNKLSYNLISDAPNIPDKTSDLTNDSGFINKNVNNLTNYSKTTDFAAVAFSGSYNDLLNVPETPTYSTVATTGDYNDLINKPALLTTDEMNYVSREYRKTQNLFFFGDTYVVTGSNNVTISDSTYNSLVLTSNATNWSHLEGKFILEPNTKYSFSCVGTCPSGVSGANYGIRHSDSSGENVLTGDSPVYLSLVFTTDSNGEYYLEFYCNYGREFGGDYTFTDITLREIAETSYVSYTDSQNLTPAQQEIARNNIGISGGSGSLDVVDNLTTNDATKALSAKQGKTLNDTLTVLLDYVYNGASNTSIDRLSEIFAFLVGHDDDETLDALLAGKIAYTDIVDNLTTNDNTKVLSAKQGKVLKDLIDNGVGGSSIGYVSVINPSYDSVNNYYYYDLNSTNLAEFQHDFTIVEISLNEYKVSALVKSSDVNHDSVTSIPTIVAHYDEDDNNDYYMFAQLEISVTDGNEMTPPGHTSPGARIYIYTDGIINLYNKEQIDSKESNFDVTASQIQNIFDEECNVDAEVEDDVLILTNADVEDYSNVVDDILELNDNAEVDNKMLLLANNNSASIENDMLIIEDVLSLNTDNAYVIGDILVID